ncbi:MAG: electron transport complex subunit RsxE [Candidatus Methanogaster sp.]|uniref:Electron transport complex subunit RsxE n=1 Tax=Candidatus Methanogaster sp. TaxID=3386292 RepID=A0AC61L3D9_9EURY|nr:MAG: electron transport complex subunit RsxE [ANME-2 cluster archaeon]
MANKSFIGEIIRGIIKDNPVFVLVLGLCPVLAVTTSFANGFGMGLAFTFVMLGSNIMVSLLRKQIPPDVRIPIFILIICTFVTMVDMLLEAYQPDMYERLGIFVPLIVVNCIVIGRAEAYANRNPVFPSIADGIGISMGFIIALVLLGSIREFLGTGTIVFDLLGYDVGKDIIMRFPAIELVIELVIGVLSPYLPPPATVMVTAPGAFLTIAVLMLLFKIMGDRKRMKQLRKEGYEI